MTSSPRHYILFVIDDDPSVRKAIERTLRSPDFTLHLFGDALEAAASIERLSPHLVLSDNAMPHKEGFELLLDLRRARPEIRTVLLTATAEADERFEKALAEGMLDAVIGKPWRQGELKSVIVELLRGDADQPET